jgi:hypothetical protein
MDIRSADYDARYLAGILYFNERDYFEAHEVWEDLWADTPGPERRFFQALIQAAVALYHFGNGNWRGARKLYQSSSNYMTPFGPHHQGLDTKRFWEDMQTCCAPFLVSGDPSEPCRPDEALLPSITLNPAPAVWPDRESKKQVDGETADETHE